MNTSSLFKSSICAVAPLCLMLAMPVSADDGATQEEGGVMSRAVASVKSFFGGEESVTADVSVAASADLAAVEAKIRATFKAGRPDLAIASVEESELPGVYAVTLQSGPVLYSSADGRFFIAGDLYELGPQGIENVAERKLMPQRAELLAAVKRDDMIIFSPEGETKGAIYVFTDVDCGYCQKLHREVPQLNAKGIEVRYLAYPRAGLQSPTYAKMLSAWCADDRNEAMNILKTRGKVEPKTCDRNPIAAQFQLGARIGVTGTPAIVTENGRLIPGYKPADQLAAIALQ